MGKGLAAKFRAKFPDMFSDYKARCERGKVSVGTPYLWEDAFSQILMFPTKSDWRKPSKIEYIDSGLSYLADNYGEMGITTLALPALGCGLGGLEWADVSKLIQKYFGDLPDIEVFVYSPQHATTLFEKDELASTIESNTNHDVAAGPY